MRPRSSCKLSSAWLATGRVPRTSVDELRPRSAGSRSSEPSAPKTRPRRFRRAGPHWPNRVRTRLRLDTAEPAQDLIGWYERRGCHPVGEVRWAGKTYDSIVMEKDLSKVAD